MTSYITTSDLEALNIRSIDYSPHPTLSHSHSHSTSTSTTTEHKKVSFCSLAVLIELADEGEVEQAMAQAFKRDLGKKQIAVRTYSLETPSFSGATSRAWCSLRNGLSATLEPLLNSGPVGSSSVTSTSRRRESSPEREKVGQYKCPTQRPNRRPRQRSSSWSDRSYTDDDSSELLDDDPTFTPNAPTRLRLKIPTVTRRCSRPCLLTSTSKPILRTSTSPTSLPLPSSPPPRSASPLPSPSLSSTGSPRKPLPPPNRVSASPPLPSSHPHAATLIPVVDCCRACCRAAEYGNLEEKFYVEHWSKGAKRLKEEQEKERREREEWAKDAQAIRSQYVGVVEKKEGQEEEEEEEDLSASQLGRKAKGVDELQLGRDKRHVKTITEKEDAGEPLQSEEKENEGISIPLEPEESRELLSGSIESTSPHSPFSDHNEASPTTPLTSPETALPIRQFEKIPPPPSSSLPPSQSESEPKRPPIGKQRSSSISRKVASFGSSFFGSSNGGISGAKFA